MLSGTVTDFSDQTGLGTVVATSGDEFRFHCIEICDGSRLIDVGQIVCFDTLPRFGVLQAAKILKI